MMSLLAGALVGVASLFGGAFMHGHMASSTPNEHAASSTQSNRIDLDGKVTSIQGDTLTVTGRRENIKVATSTFTIDATNARVLKLNSATSTGTSTVSDIHVNDLVRIHGVMNNGIVDARVIIDGVLRKMKMGLGKHPHTATSTPNK